MVQEVQSRKDEEVEELALNFIIDPQELSSLFEIDNIRDKVSQSKLIVLGGAKGLLDQLFTNLKAGINTKPDEIKARKIFYGDNKPALKKRKTLFQMIMDCFEDLMLQILCIASFVSTTIGILEDGFQKGWMEGGTIILAVIIIISISAGNNYVKEKQFQKLSEKREQMNIQVTRNGKVKIKNKKIICTNIQVIQIDSKELLVGDLLHIQIGDVMPVDGILLEGSEISMDESSVTGESDLVTKCPALSGEVSQDTYFLISGSKVMDGSGLILVCTVGSNTQLGKLKEKLQEEQPPTPLQKKLETVAEDIGKVGSVAACLTMCAILIHLIMNIILGEHCFLCIESLKEIINSFLVAVTIIVVAVPEGLPLAVTIALAYSVNKMKEENNLVKQLSSCEIMGGKIKVQVIKKFADQALRTLALAYKDIEIQPGTSAQSLNENFLETNLTLIAIAGIKDPIRTEIPKAIQICYRAGIRVRMVTGDNLNTAVAIAKDCKILTQDYKVNQNNYEVMEGKKFRELIGGIAYDNPYAQNIEDRGEAKIFNFDIFKKIVKELKILARSTPDDKYMLVTGLIQITNDAPALKKADVGFAMGIAGTEVAKEAAGIILLDDNFVSIVTACKYGRNIYDSIRKFIQFQLTVNAVALFMCFMGAVVIKQSPLNSIQMLWVNIIMDTFASLALSTENPSDLLLLRQPYGRNDSIITPNMWRNIVGQSIYQITVLILILFKFPQWLGIQSSVGITKFSQEKGVHFTIFFQAFVLLQIFNEFNARKLERHEINVFTGLFNNYLFWLIIILTFIIQLFMIQFGGEYVGVSQLTLYQHLICIGVGSGALIMELLIKIFPNFLFNKIKIFREDQMEFSRMEKSLPSLVRKRSSIRYNCQGLGVSEQNIKQQNNIN
ncbi:hypothetical protein IMG5_125530 [Ichthyophthirius multifiliis]|uniref:P-type Ca(2+) transporter n=1 Tax=Ichthyophthirius multifiliis TaxID=5932 RepID=G0QVR3_ICHMU|nr:hypothetical protein IMG5_125530 [Ichthyophthirius multifiliis]EGR30692.1 hypothetical protein IMG5_125530 [Ichthyophthirius multifiliis]|eukprot:XP_004032279.1 hypothetical protein IMG5_125530 [Ichthyophthirius multifiliis]